MQTDTQIYVADITANKCIEKGFDKVFSKQKV